MVKALGIEIRPLLDDPLPSNGFACWEPWPPRVAQHFFMKRFRELAHASRSSMSPNALLRTRGGPTGKVILASSNSEPLRAGGVRSERALIGDRREGTT